MIVRCTKQCLAFLSRISLAVLITVAAQPKVLATNSFQQALQLANSLKGKAKEAVGKFNPQEVFKNQKGGYTEEPSQTGHYQGTTQLNAFDMEKSAHNEILKDEPVLGKDGNPRPTPGKVVAEGFQKREVYKINQEAEFMQKGKLITGNAQSIVMGESNKNIDCENQKLSSCKTVQIEKTCNEEIRTVQRVCEKVPNVSSFVREITYPNCQHLVMIIDGQSSCPAGYDQILHTGEIRTALMQWKEARLCTKSISPQDNIECYFGKYYIGINQQGSERAIIPKKFHSRIKFSNVHGSETKATIINETTGQTLYNEGTFSNGQVIELPYSDIQDQTFRFYIIPSPGFMVWEWGHIGVMALYINSKYREQGARLESWQEACHDV